MVVEFQYAFQNSLQSLGKPKLQDGGAILIK